MTDISVGSADITFNPTNFTVTIPLSLLGGDNGYVNVAAIMGNQTGPTDCVPNGGHLSLLLNMLALPLVRK
jgi:hypothetical protein